MAHRVYVFADAAQLREKLKDIGARWNRADLLKVGFVLVNQLNSGNPWLGEKAQLSRVFVYDAVGETGDPEVETWLKRNDEREYVHVRRGALAGEVRRGGRSQKAVDVRLTVDALTWAQNGAYDIAIIMSGDGDFAPLAEAIRARGVGVFVAAFADKLSPLLATEADRVIALHEDANAWHGWELDQ